MAMCRTQSILRSGTLFHASRLPLTLWFQAMVSFRQACMNSVRWSGTVGAPRTG